MPKLREVESQIFHVVRCMDEMGSSGLQYESKKVNRSNPTCEVTYALLSSNL